MKYKDSKKLKNGKYLITLEVTDKDIEMFEDLTLTYKPFELNKIYKKDCERLYKQGRFGEIDYNFHTLEICDFTNEYLKWLNNLFWNCFHKIWRVHD